MKNLIMAFCLVLFGDVTIAQSQSVKFRAFDPLMNRLVKVEWISNHDPGFGSPNEFYKLSKEFLQSHGPADFKRMVNHPNAIVRAMGLLCLTQTEGDVLVLLTHWKDETVVWLSQGCMRSQITIGEFAQRLLRSPHFLDP